MKKTAIFLCLIGLFAGLCAADAGNAPAAAAAVEDPAPWTFVQLCFLPGFPPDSDYTEVCGVKVGAPFSAGEAPVYGVEASVLNAGTEVVYGVKTGLICTIGRKIAGLQFSIVNIAETVSGLQLGIYNQAKGPTFQIGLLNFIEDGALPFFPVMNFKF